MNFWVCGFKFCVCGAKSDKPDVVFVVLRLLAIQANNHYELFFEHKYVCDINNVWNAHTEEGLIKGRNVEDSALMSIYLHEIYCN